MEGTISEIRLWGPTWTPRNWFSCSGQLLSISQFTAFFSLIGTIYGGDGRTSFAVPDLRGRTAVGYGSGSGLTPRSAGQGGGAEFVTLNSLEIPAHNHSASVTAGTGPSSATVSVRANSGAGNTNNPAGGYWANSGNVGPNAINSYSNTQNVTMAADAVTVDNVTAPTPNVNIGLTGGNQSHLNMQPWLSVGYIICYQGIFPSRN
ncbi:MAG: tail fiber protein [Bacteroidota bacterium]